MCLRFVEFIFLNLFLYRWVGYCQIFAAVGSLWGFLAETIILMRLPANWWIKEFIVCSSKTSKPSRKSLCNTSWEMLWEVRERILAEALLHWSRPLNSCSSINTACCMSRCVLDTQSWIRLPFIYMYPSVQCNMVWLSVVLALEVAALTQTDKWWKRCTCTRPWQLNIELNRPCVFFVHWPPPRG